MEQTGEGGREAILSRGHRLCSEAVHGMGGLREVVTVGGGQRQSHGAG